MRFALDFLSSCDIVIVSFTMYTLLEYYKSLLGLLPRPL